MLQKLRRAWQLTRAIQLVWQSSPKWTIANISLAFLQGILPLASLYLTKLIVDAVSAGLTKTAQTNDPKQVIELVIVTGLITLLSELCSALSQFVKSAQSQFVTDHVHSLLHLKSIEVDLEYYENAQYYDTLHMAQEEASYRPNEILNLVIQLGQSGVSLVAIAALLITLHWSVPSILLLTAIPALLVRLKFAKHLYEQQRAWTSQERRAGAYSWMLTNTVHAKEVRLYNLGALFERRFRHLRQGIRRKKLLIAKRSIIAEWIVQGCTILAVFTVFGLISYQAFIGSITIGSLVLYYQAFQRGQNSLREVLQTFAQLYENNLFISNLYEFLDLKRKVAEPQNPQPFPDPIQAGIEFRNVQFRYPNTSRSLLEGINLTIRAGETIALVGENGAGKTTLIKLLCRLYDPTQGSITVDGIDFKEFATQELRSQIGVVFQDYAHYNLSAGENIGLGNINVLHDNEAIHHAANLAGANKAITRLPNQYDTILGREFEEGEELSIGEWQKIAIARAFLRQSQIMILDEPSSALDARAEYEVFEQFRKLTQNRTAILISHRLSTVKLADRIYMLKDGKIVEQGTHPELIQRKGVYAQLFELQSSSYQHNA